MDKQQFAEQNATYFLQFLVNSMFFPIVFSLENLLEQIQEVNPEEDEAEKIRKKKEWPERNKSDVPTLDVSGSFNGPMKDSIVFPCIFLEWRW